MKRRLTFPLVVLAALLLSYGVLVRVAPVPSPPEPAAAAQKGGLKALAAPRDPGEYDSVTVKIVIPPQAEFPAIWAEGGGCPHNVISAILGAQIGGAGGVPVFSIQPGKPAAKAGIQPGDRLGGPNDCPSSLSGSFAPGKEPRTITWTVRRPKSTARQHPVGKPLAAPQQSDAAAGSR